MNSNPLSEQNLQEMMERYRQEMMQLRTGNDNAAEHGLGVARPKPGKTRRQSRDGGARYRAMLSAGRACPQQMRSHTAR